jgi:outer membrane protein assembly factor BamB
MEQRGDEELVTCYAVAAGELRWSHAVAARHSTTLGGIGPRCTPTIEGGRVYALGATGVLRCLDGASGQSVWTVDLLETMGLTPEQDLKGIAWGRATSPLIVDGLVVVPLGGPKDGPWVSLAAYRQDTGELVWKAGERQASYSSPTLATLNGVRQILIVCQDYVAGHKADGGELLWEHAWPGCSSTDATVSQPVAFGEDRVLLSKGYSGGSQLLRVLFDPARGWHAEELWARKNLLRTKFTNVVLRGPDAYALSDGILECVDLEQGKRLWKEGRYGQGQVLGVDDLLIVQAESGEVVLVEASPAGLNVLGRLNALDGKTWNNPALYDHYLLVRNAEEAACYQLP